MTIYFERQMTYKRRVLFAFRRQFLGVVNAGALI